MVAGELAAAVNALVAASHATLLAEHLFGDLSKYLLLNPQDDLLDPGYVGLALLPLLFQPLPHPLHNAVDLLLAFAVFTRDGAHRFAPSVVQRHVQEPYRGDIRSDHDRFRCPFGELHPILNEGREEGRQAGHGEG